MKASKRDEVCIRTERKEEQVQLKNLKTGELAFTNFCTTEGGTIQVKLSDGSLDSWSPADCEEI